MNTTELDRLVSKTEMNPATKQALRHVRKAVLSGRASSPDVHAYDWCVSVENDGAGVRFRFSMKKANLNGSED